MFRPPETAQRKGYQLIDQANNESEREDEDHQVAVQFGELGVFDCRAVDVLISACKASLTKVRVKEEEKWLQGSNGALKATQIHEVASLLFGSKSEQEILRVKDVFVVAMTSRPCLVRGTLMVFLLMFSVESTLRRQS